MVKCCELHAGMLTEPVEFQRATKTSDGAGGYVEAWTALDGSSALAHVKALSGGERYASERTEATSKWRVTARYFSGLLESDKVIIRDKSYNVRFVNNVELRNQWLIIDVDGGVAG